MTSEHSTILVQGVPPLYTYVIEGSLSWLVLELLASFFANTIVGPSKRVRGNYRLLFPIRQICSSQISCPRRQRRQQHRSRRPQDLNQHG